MQAASRGTLRRCANWLGFCVLYADVSCATVTLPSFGNAGPKVGTTGTGTCGDTSYGGTCADHPYGSYNSTTAGIQTLQACVEKVKGCSNGNYVSYSAKNEDCSWYAHCDMDSLLHVRAGQ